MKLKPKTTKNTTDQYKIEIDTVFFIHSSVDFIKLLQDPFNEATGLWEFPCRSKHKPRPDLSEELAEAIQSRDMFLSPSEVLPCGRMPGPDLYPPIPEQSCPCNVSVVKQMLLFGIADCLLKWINYHEYLSQKYKRLSVSVIAFLKSEIKDAYSLNFGIF